MASKMTKAAYGELIEEDINWLKKYAKDDLEQNHIIAVLRDSVRTYYPAREINFSSLRNANVTRCVEWMGALPSTDDATFHACELGGEVGEALNIIKKFDRLSRGVPGSIDRATTEIMLKEELADVIICVGYDMVEYHPHPWHPGKDRQLIHINPLPAEVDDYTSSYRNEVAYAGYYGVELGERGLIAEMTATPRTGVFRFWFPRDAPAHIIVDPSRGISWFRNRGQLAESIAYAARGPGYRLLLGPQGARYQLGAAGEARVAVHVDRYLGARDRIAVCVDHQTAVEGRPCQFHGQLLLAGGDPDFATPSHITQAAFDAIQAGATGYLLKDTPREELFSAIRAAAKTCPRLFSAG